MRIVFDCERMKYAHTGLFEYCLQLARALKQNKDSEDKLLYYLKPELQKHFDSDDEFLDQHGLQKFIFPSCKGVDLWHTTYQLSSYIPRNKKIKRVLTVHDLNFLHEEKSPAKVKKYLHKHQQIIDLADHIVTISSFTKKDVLNHLDTAGKPLTVIYNGCAKSPVLTGDKPVSASDKPFLFALGTVNPKKNFHVLVPLLNNNDFELIIAGKIDGSYQDKIMAEAAIHGVAHKVKIVGAVTEQEKHWYYKNCEAFLFPSLAEGFGIPPIEAMTYGKPVFLSDRTSLPEIGGDAAYYLRSFDPTAVQSAFDEGMAHYRLNNPSKKIIAHAAQFDWENTAKAYLEVYKSTVYG